MPNENEDTRQKFNATDYGLGCLYIFSVISAITTSSLLIGSYRAQLRASSSFYEYFGPIDIKSDVRDVYGALKKDTIYNKAQLVDQMNSIFNHTNCYDTYLYNEVWYSAYNYNENDSQGPGLKSAFCLCVKDAYKPIIQKITGNDITVTLSDGDLTFLHRKMENCTNHTITPVKIESLQNAKYNYVANSLMWITLGPFVISMMLFATKQFGSVMYIGLSGITVILNIVTIALFITTTAMSNISDLYIGLMCTLTAVAFIICSVVQLAQQFNWGMLTLSQTQLDSLVWILNAFALIVVFTNHMHFNGIRDHTYLISTIFICFTPCLVAVSVDMETRSDNGGSSDPSSDGSSAPSSDGSSTMPYTNVLFLVMSIWFMFSDGIIDVTDIPFLIMVVLFAVQILRKFQQSKARDTSNNRGTDKNDTTIRLSLETLARLMTMIIIFHKLG